MKRLYLEQSGQVCEQAAASACDKNVLSHQECPGKYADTRGGWGLDTAICCPNLTVPLSELCPPTAVFAVKSACAGLDAVVCTGGLDCLVESEVAANDTGSDIMAAADLILLPL